MSEEKNKLNARIHILSNTRNIMCPSITLKSKHGFHFSSMLSELDLHSDKSERNHLYQCCGIRRHRVEVGDALQCNHVRGHCTDHRVSEGGRQNKPRTHCYKLVLPSANVKKVATLLAKSQLSGFPRVLCNHMRCVVLTILSNKLHQFLDFLVLLFL